MIAKRQSMLWAEGEGRNSKVLLVLSLHDHLLSS